MRAGRERLVAEVAQESAGRVLDPVAAVDLAWLAEEFARAENIPIEAPSCFKDTAIGLALGTGVGLLLILRWLRRWLR